MTFTTILSLLLVAEGIAVVPETVIPIEAQQQVDEFDLEDVSAQQSPVVYIHTVYVIEAPQQSPWRLADLSEWDREFNSDMPRYEIAPGWYVAPARLMFESEFEQPPIVCDWIVA